ncbi:MAG: hypothetical protein AVDCRST_MAG23-529, partial [uncultured Sphingosinicella sp.]
EVHHQGSRDRGLRDPDRLRRRWQRRRCRGQPGAGLRQHVGRARQPVRECQRDGRQCQRRHRRYAREPGGSPGEPVRSGRRVERDQHRRRSAV